MYIKVIKQSNIQEIFKFKVFQEIFDGRIKIWINSKNIKFISCSTWIRISGVCRCTCSVGVMGALCGVVHIHMCMCVGWYRNMNPVRIPVHVIMNMEISKKLWTPSNNGSKAMKSHFSSSNWVAEQFHK